jgi:predicted dehydrogenase
VAGDGRDALGHAGIESHRRTGPDYDGRVPTGEPIRVCIAGFGGRGVEQVDALLGGEGSWEIAGVADRSAIAYGRLQARYYDRRIPVVRRAADLVSLEPDAVLVSTTAAAHVPVSLELLEAGYEGALLVEKPLASSVAEARRLADALGAWPGRAGVDFQRRCSRMYAELARVLASGELGRIRSIRYTTESPQRISMDGSHKIDLANWLAGSRPVAVRGRLDVATVDRRGAFYVDPSGVVDVEYEHGTSFRLDASGAGTDPGLSIVCEHGGVAVEPSEEAVLVTGPEGERTIPTDAGERPRMTSWFESTLRALAVGADGLRPCTIEEGATDLEVVAAAFLSGERGGEPVALPLEPEEAERELRVA